MRIVLALCLLATGACTIAESKPVDEMAGWSLPQ